MMQSASFPPKFRCPCSFSEEIVPYEVDMTVLPTQRPRQRSASAA